MLERLKPDVVAVGGPLLVQTRLPGPLSQKLGVRGAVFTGTWSGKSPSLWAQLW